MPFIIGVDQRQHLNLSEYAWTKIEEDILNFFDSPIDNSNYSGFLNVVIRNYYDVSSASINLRLEDYEDEITDLIHTKTFANVDSKTKRMLLNALKDNYKSKLLDNVLNYPKGKSVKFRINNDNYEFLTEECTEDIHYDSSSGLYLKALIEEYAREPHHVREKIFYKSRVDTIHDAINRKKKLKVKLANGYNYHVSPFDIKIDKTGAFSYLVGYVDDSMVSFRLSKLTSFRVLESKPLKISRDAREKLEKTLTQFGPQFLIGEIKEIVVKLSERGIRLYHNQIHLRPPLKRIEKNNHYHLECSELQALFYFFKFGREATVLSPPGLADKFKKYYETALENYR